MTDDAEDQSEPGGMFSPDGWGVYHHWSEPVEDVHGYMFGPFPTYDIAKYIMEASPCKCATSLVPLMFPKGIIMMAGMDVDGAKEALEAITGGREVKVPTGTSHLPDRVH